MTDAPQPILSIQGFLFEAPLYAPYSLAKGEGFDPVFAMFVRELVVDGHCIECGKSSTFHRTIGKINILDKEIFLNWKDVFLLKMVCTRNKDHAIDFLIRNENEIIQKIGQFPSLSDIANNESRAYRKVLSREDAAELHKAIGLAAHGVGVGSFVYLRRIFERLIVGRFESYKVAEGWRDEAFFGKRMGEKIEILEHHLPDFLVNNKKIYGILSKGMHELDEKECLGAFEMLKHSIFFILDEDKRKREELERRSAAEKAIAAFKGKLWGPMPVRSNGGLRLPARRLTIKPVRRSKPIRLSATEPTSSKSITIAAPSEEIILAYQGKTA